MQTLEKDILLEDLSRESIVNFLKKNKGRVVTFLYYDFRNDFREIIGCIGDIHENFGYVEITHPMELNLDSTKIDKNKLTILGYKMFAGTCGVYFDNEHGHIENILYTTKDEFEEWKRQYLEFHKKILKIEKHDICEEDLEKCYS